MNKERLQIIEATLQAGLLNTYEKQKSLADVLGISPAQVRQFIATKRLSFSELQTNVGVYKAFDNGNELENMRMISIINCNEGKNNILFMALPDKKLTTAMNLWRNRKFTFQKTNEVLNITLE